MQSGDAPRHIPVLHTDGGSPVDHTVLGVLQPQSGESVLDVTLGLGGHAASFLERVGESGSLTGLDADAENLALATEKLRKHWPKTFQPVHCNFRQAGSLERQFHIVFADLGVSSPHFDDPTRGFTFRVSAPLDLRFDRSGGWTGADFLKRSKEDDLIAIFRKYGELREAKRIAVALSKAANAEQGIATTEDLRLLIESLFGYRAPQVLPQIFQALRIAVNDEMGALEDLLSALPSLLLPGGRAGIISYHSLEDRLVKHAFRLLCTPQKDPVTGGIAIPADWELLTAKAIVPSDEEIRKNPRSRSAKFRAIRRLR